MKKFFLLIVVFVISSSFYFLGSSNALAASKVGDGCNTSPDGLYDSCSDGGLVCNLTTLKCEAPAGEKIQCSCQNPGKSGGGQNGFTCGGGPVAYCDNSSLACQNTNPDQLGASEDSASKYPGKLLYGITCSLQESKATCTCTGGGNIKCTQDGSNPVVEGTATCGSDSPICVAAPGQAFNDPITNKQGQLFDTGIFGSTPYKVGVACKKAVTTCTCDTPGIRASGQNGLSCTGPNGEKAQTYCNDTSLACTNSQGQSIERNSLRDRDIIPGTDLQGVFCQPKPQPTPYPTIPPPPPPPCLNWSGGAAGTGTCTQFGTAMGALGTAPEQFITRLFAILLSLSGGIAILLIIRSGYQLMTSRAKPEAINSARDQLTAAIVGLIFLIFSFVVLQVIGFDILRIPGFTGAGAGSTGGGNGVAGAACDVNGNNVCSNGLKCVSQGSGNGRAGTCQ